MTVHDTVESRTLGDLFAAHHPHLVRLAMVLTGDRELAADIAQDAFVRLGCRPTRRWPAPGSELAYLRRTVVNLSHGHHRHLRVVRRNPAEPPGLAGDPSVEAIRRDGHDRVLAAVRQLPARQRECVVLRYFADLNDGEVAESLGISRGSVKTHLHRARAALADLLEETK